MDLNGQSVLIVGGSSGIGFGVAQAVLAAGGKVTIASRSPEKLASASERLGGVATHPLDTGDAAAIDAFFAAQAPFDHIVVSASKTKVAPVRELTLEEAMASFNSKFWGAYRIAKAAKLVQHGSLTFVSGFLSTRPRKGAAIQGAINAALEGLTRGVALEFAPARVNCVSPGLVMTEMYDGLDSDARRAMFDGAAEKLPVGFVGKPEHVAIQVLAFMTNRYMTGTTVYIDGGGLFA